ncbi:MAG: carbon-nitrogen hydrolase family protein [Candidatus Eremiobacteraeota bacterium]|nr:carbon-nitrogen hydrolase family protein [Candidatus Eremiobacteraeota bacterium]
MTRTLRIAALQLRAHDRDALPDRLNGILDLASRAAASCDLLVLPEATFPAYVIGGDEFDDAQVQPGIDALRAIASRNECTIVTGAVQKRNGALYNCAVAIDPDGSVAGTAEKTFLWHFDRKWFAAGAELAPVHTAAGSLGLLICADGRMPGVARALVDRGADVLVMPTAWVTSGRDPTALENVQADLLARVRAFENNVALVAANKCGTERGMVAYCGKSQIIDRDGTVAATGDARSEGAIFARLAIEKPRPYRSASPAIATTAERPPLRAIRVAIAIEPLPRDIDARLDLLDAEIALAPDSPYGAQRLNELLSIVEIAAEAVLDPGALIAARLSGMRVAIIDAPLAGPWLETIARARALELRIYVIVFDRQNHRAYAIDPEGAIVAGTFDDYSIASFSLDGRRTAETSLAPGTDVVDGLERIDLLARAQARVR